MKLNVRNKILLSVLPILIVSLCLAGFICYRVASKTVLDGEIASMNEPVDQM